MQISWPEVATISVIISGVALLERWITGCWNRTKQRKKLLIYHVFDTGEHFLTADEILRKLVNAGRARDLENEHPLLTFFLE